MKKMLINATHKEEVRIALVQDNELVDLDIEQKNNTNKKSNIYNGQISRVEPSLEACFVNYGHNRDGFLPFKDIDPSYYDNNPDKFKEKITPGKKLIVQVTREERGNKGAALTTQISLASTFLVLMPMSDKQEGISRRLSADEREALRRKIQAIDKKDGKGIIVRTAGTGCSQEELAHDLNILNYIWEKIQEYAKTQDKVGILHHESETIIRVLRDYLTKDVDEIVTDSKDAYEKAEHYLNLVRPQSKPKVSLYQDDNQDLFRYYRIEDQINTAFQRKVSLKSGGELVIDTTEALTSIDVNSSKSTSGSDIEQTAYTTNMEAAKEIARQLKIRDLGGLIVIDFIDMSKKTNIKDIEESMRNLTKDDRARIQTAPISKFGLMEISRQRIRGSIAESNNHICPRCSGTGFIRDNESLALHILREMNKEVSKPGRAVKLHLITPVEIATFLNNEKKQDISDFEERNKVEVNIISDPQMVTPHFSIQRVRKGDSNFKDLASYQLADYYREQERASAKNNRKNKDSIHEQLHHSTSSVPDEYEDKTFEARLEKADFLKETKDNSSSNISLFIRVLNWVKSFWAKKEVNEYPAKEASQISVIEERPQRRRSNKKRSRKQKRTDNNVEVVVTDSKVKEEVVTKEVTSGSVVETIVSKPSRRRSRKQSIIQDDINPQKVKAELEEKEYKNYKSVKDTQEEKEPVGSNSISIKESKDSKENKDNSSLVNTDSPRISKSEKRRLRREKQALEAEYDYSLEDEDASKQHSKSRKQNNQSENLNQNNSSIVKNTSKGRNFTSKDNASSSKVDSSEPRRKSRERNRSRKVNRVPQEVESYNYLLETKDFPIREEVLESWAQGTIKKPAVKEVSLVVNLETGISSGKLRSAQERRNDRKRNFTPVGTLNSSNFEIKLDSTTSKEERNFSNKEVKVAKEKNKQLKNRSESKKGSGNSYSSEQSYYRRIVFKSPQPCVNFHDKIYFENANKLRQRNLHQVVEQELVENNINSDNQEAKCRKEVSTMKTTKTAKSYLERESVLEVNSELKIEKEEITTARTDLSQSPAYRGYLSGNSISTNTKRVEQPKIKKIELEDLQTKDIASLKSNSSEKERADITKTAKAIATVNQNSNNLSDSLTLDSSNEKDSTYFFKVPKRELFPKK